MVTYKGGYDFDFHIKMPDSSTPLMSNLDKRFLIKTEEGWLTATRVGGKKLRTLTPSGEWITITRFQPIEPAPVLWIVASDSHDVRDGNVWELFAHEGIGPSLCSSPVWYDYNTYALYVPTSDINEDFYRIKEGVNGFLGLYCDSTSGTSTGYQQLFSFWRWWDPAIEESAQGVYSAYTLPSPEVPRWRKYADLVEGWSVFFVFSIGSSAARHGVYLEISQAFGAYSDEPFMYLAIARRIGISSPDNLEVDMAEWARKPSDGGEYVERYTEQGSTLQPDTLYVAEIVRDRLGNVTARINGTDITNWDYERTESLNWPSGYTPELTSSSVGEAKFVILEALNPDDDLIYECKVYSGAITGATLIAEREYFSSKYGVST